LWGKKEGKLPTLMQGRAAFTTRGKRKKKGGPSIPIGREKKKEKENHIYILTGEPQKKGVNFLAARRNHLHTVKKERKEWGLLPTTTKDSSKKIRIEGNLFSEGREKGGC